MTVHRTRAIVVILVEHSSDDEELGQTDRHRGPLLAFLLLQLLLLCLLRIAEFLLDTYLCTASDGIDEKEKT